MTSHSETESMTIVNIMHREYSMINGRLRPKDELHLSDQVPRIGTKSRHKNGPEKKLNVGILR